ncbi:hypothetical protein BESB_002220 [Besnoitia besnoiti]|uniref:ORC1/DEAH AAA+ ATPase domain-containing protein n=1 Tax=Besnoitia besnoiti TaxID=94643 RepID=A0A2A9MN22_BESBE|nr:hypothetical protein BESB_002220 [Besnoitia besnoiti]PFH37881.1 hypothetical protein BESB_002220 [Besnoitia besnoiti]
MPRAPVSAAAGPLPLPTSPTSIQSASQRSSRGKKPGAPSSQALAAAIVASPVLSKKRREPSCLVSSTRDAQEPGEATPRQNAPGTKKRRNSSSRVRSLSTRPGGGAEGAGVSAGIQGAGSAFLSSSSVASPAKEVAVAAREERPAEGEPEGPGAAPPRRFTRQRLREDLIPHQGEAECHGSQEKDRHETPGGRSGRGRRKGVRVEQLAQQGEPEESSERQPPARGPELRNGGAPSSFVEGGKGREGGEGAADGEEEVETASPPKQGGEKLWELELENQGHRSGFDGASESEVEETEEDLRLRNLEDEIDKFETALTLLRPTLGDYAGERDDSVQAISTHIDKLLARKRGGMIYLCGASGTGKTCTALHVLDRKLKESKHRGKIHKELVTVSCAHREKDAQLFCEMLVRMLPASGLPSERALYADLKATLMKEGIGGLVTRFASFTKKFDKFWLCLVDEVDFLATTGKIRTDVLCGAGRKSGRNPGAAGAGGSASSQKNALQQDILMALALAATHPQSKIIVVAISNSSELAQHFTGLPIPSLTFCPYTERQLTALLLKRLEVLGCQRCFATPAILVFARKAANTYGDFRMALSGFCRAIEDKLGALHDHRAQALRAAASRRQSSFSRCSTTLPSRFVTGQTLLDSPTSSAGLPSPLSSSNRRSRAALLSSFPAVEADASPASGAASRDADARGGLPPSAPSSPSAVAKATRRNSLVRVAQGGALCSQKEAARGGDSQASPTPLFAGALSQSALTDETPEHMHQMTPSTVASSLYPSPLASGPSSCPSPAMSSCQSMCDARRKPPTVLQKCLLEEAMHTTGFVRRGNKESAEGAVGTPLGLSGGDGAASAPDERADSRAADAWTMTPPSLHALSLATPREAAGDRQLHIPRSVNREAVAAVESAEKSEGRVAERDGQEEGEETESRSRGDVLGQDAAPSFRRARSDILPLGSQKPKAQVFGESRNTGKPFLPSPLSAAVPHFVSGGLQRSHSSLQPSGSHSSYPAVPVSSLSPSSPSLASFASASTSTPPSSPFAHPGSAGHTPLAALSQTASGQRRRRSQLSALKLLQLQQNQPSSEHAEQMQSHRRPSCSSSSCASSRRSLELRDIQNLKNVSSKVTSPLSHLMVAASRVAGSRSPLSSTRDPSRSGDERAHEASEGTDRAVSRGDTGSVERTRGVLPAGDAETRARRGGRRSGEGAGLADLSEIEGRPSVSPQVIGVGEMNARAGAIFGNDQQHVVSRIQGLPLMHQVYLLAACRSAMKRVYEANQAAGAANGRARGEKSAAGGRHSQENVSNQQKEQLLGCGGSVDITFTDVEVQYRQLCQELQNGYLLSQHMATSCWRHALEAFEQMGLMRPTRSAGVLGSTSSTGFSGLSGGGAGAASVSSGAKGGLWGGAAVGSARGGFGAFGPFGGGGRRSSAGLFAGKVGTGAGTGGAFRTKLVAEREQAWELQMSPALIEAAIKRLQPILMSSDLEEHFTRGLEA